MTTRPDPEEHEHDWYLTEGRSAATGRVDVWLRCPCGKTRKV